LCNSWLMACTAADSTLATSRRATGRGDRRAGASPGSPLRPGAAAGAHLRGGSRDCTDSCMGIRFVVPITRSGLQCLAPPVPHRAVPSTVVAGPSAHCSIARCRPILPPGWRFGMMAPGQARQRSPSGNFAATSTAASSPTASPVPAALRAGTTSSLPTPASVAGSGPPAPPAAWWRPPRIWPTMSSRAWPLRQAVTALAQPAEIAAAPTPVEPIPPEAAPAEPMRRQAARYVWALLPLVEINVV